MEHEGLHNLRGIVAAPAINVRCCIQVDLHRNRGSDGDALVSPCNGQFNVDVHGPGASQGKWNRYGNGPGAKHDRGSIAAQPSRKTLVQVRLEGRG